MTLNLQDLQLEHLMGGLFDPDVPLPSVAGFDRLARDGSLPQIKRLCGWIEPQATIDYVIKHHGFAGAKRVTAGIARAASKHKLPMGSRVRAVCGALGLETY